MLVTVTHGEKRDNARKRRRRKASRTHNVFQLLFMILRIDTYGQYQGWEYLGVFERLLYHTVSHLRLDFYCDDLSSGSAVRVRVVSKWHSERSMAWR